MKISQYAGLVSLMFAAACGNSTPPPPAAPPPVKVTLQEVREGSAVFHEEYPAIVNALNQVELRAQVNGFVTGIHFADGARVKKGQLLYSIDAQLYEANYGQAVANLQVQEANLARAQKDVDRYHELEKNDAIAKQLVDNAEAALEVAKKQAEAAKANIRAVQTSVRYTRVIAPFDGLVGISQVKSGTAVSAGQTLLNTISSDNELAADINLDQREIFRFTQLLKQKNQDSTFSLAFGTDIYPLPGRLALMDRAVDPQTGTIRARIVFANPDKLLRAGMNATLRVKTTAPANSIIIPYKAITEQLGEFFVYVKTDSSKVTQKKVLLGTVIGRDIIIREGLKPGDSVVTQGVQSLREGAVIVSVPPSAAASAERPKK